MGYYVWFCEKPIVGWTSPRSGQWQSPIVQKRLWPDRQLCIGWWYFPGCCFFVLWLQCFATLTCLKSCRVHRERVRWSENVFAATSAESARYFHFGRQFYTTVEERLEWISPAFPLVRLAPSSATTSRMLLCACWTKYLSWSFLIYEWK